PAYHRRTGAHERADGLRVLRVYPGLRAVRDPWRLPGRPDGGSTSADANRHLVVFFHRGHRLGLEFRFDRDDAVLFRRGRSGLLSEPHEVVHHLAATGGKGASAGNPLDERPLGWSVHASAGVSSIKNDDMAARLR